jgi:hypothetical protein
MIFINNKSHRKLFYILVFSSLIFGFCVWMLNEDIKWSGKEIGNDVSSIFPGVFYQFTDLRIDIFVVGDVRRLDSRLHYDMTSSVDRGGYQGNVSTPLPGQISEKNLRVPPCVLRLPKAGEKY